jgi:ribonuclease HII
MQSMPNNRPRPNWTFEDQLSSCTQWIAGVDEAGRGSWVGPVAASACLILNRKAISDTFWSEVQDSKRLTRRKREFLYHQLVGFQEQGLIRFGVGFASEKVVDTFGIVHATDLAMNQAVSELNHPLQTILVDGLRYPPSLGIAGKAIVRGDQTSFSIACASIIAKVTRDHYMVNLHFKHPIYHWDRNKGYGTMHHWKILQKEGITSYHRTSFKPIKILLKIS